jgi:hypothetical protein
MLPVYNAGMKASIALLVLLAPAALAARADTTLGAGVTLDRTTPIADVIEKPAAFAGQTVRVEGVVTAVCEHMGCWMTLAPAGATGATPATLRLKVEDGVIVFPVSAKGRTAVAQGVVTAIGAGDHHGGGHHAGGDHAAHQAGRAAAADHAGQHAAARAATHYQLEVTGAILR